MVCTKKSLSVNAAELFLVYTVNDVDEATNAVALIKEVELGVTDTN